MSKTIALAANWTAFSELTKGRSGVEWVTKPEQLEGVHVGEVLFCPSFLAAPFAADVLRALRPPICVGDLTPQQRLELARGGKGDERDQLRAEVERLTAQTEDEAVYGDHNLVPSLRTEIDQLRAQLAQQQGVPDEMRLIGDNSFHAGYQDYRSGDTVEVSSNDNFMRGWNACRDAMLAAPVQGEAKPVAKVVWADSPNGLGVELLPESEALNPGDKLYTTPPQLAEVGELVGALSSLVFFIRFHKLMGEGAGGLLAADAALAKFGGAK